MAEPGGAPLKCRECGTVCGYFDLERLPRALQVALRALVSQFATDHDAPDDDFAAPVIVCRPCRERR